MVVYRLRCACGWIAWSEDKETVKNYNALHVVSPRHQQWMAMMRRDRIEEGMKMFA